MDVSMVVSRLVHIFSGVVWVGAIWSMAMFIGPTARAVGADGQKFMQHFIMRSSLQRVLTTVGILTVASGLFIYYRLFGGLANLNTGNGLALTVGGAAGLAALVVGIQTGGIINRMRAISGEVAKAGVPPNPEQSAELAKLQEGMAIRGAVNAILMAVALAGMSLSEYFAF